MKKDEGKTRNKCKALVKRFKEYERWQQGEHNKGNMTIPELPSESFPSPRELTVREMFALLRLLDDHEMNVVMDQMHDTKWKGFEDTSSGMYRWINRVLDMSNNDIADYLSGRKVFSRRTTLRHRLLSILESTLGPNGELGNKSQWRYWLDEEIKFWLLEGYIPPRIAEKIWKRKFIDFEFPCTDAWEELMQDLNQALYDEKVGNDIACKNKYKTGWFEGIKECLKICAEQTKINNAIWKPGEFIGKKKKLDIRTIQAALEQEGYRWKRDVLLVECGEWVKETKKKTKNKTQITNLRKQKT